MHAIRSSGSCHINRTSQSVPNTRKFALRRNKSFYRHQALSSDASGETDWARELSSAIVRVGAGVFMVHNGLDKLVDPEGFAKFVVEPFLSFLPMPIAWTYSAAIAEIAGAVGLTLGLFTRLSSLSLLGTMSLAVLFHINQTGLEGFPLAVVEKHQYAYETAALYCLLYFYFLVNGGGTISLDSLIGSNKK